MGKKEEYLTAIGHILDDSAGVTSQLTKFLSLNSKLPGPRANLELLEAFTAMVGERCRLSPERFWKLSTEFSESPYEFVAMCGVRGVGAMGAKLHVLTERSLEKLSVSAASPRWRVREAVAMALQDLIRADPTVARRLEEWVSQGDWLHMRAVAVGVAEPRILKDDKVAAAVALQLHRDVIGKMLSGDDRRTEGFRVLRQALGYTLSAVVAGAPEAGFSFMRTIILDGDPDGLWICRENLKKERLESAYPGEVRELRSLMA